MTSAVGYTTPAEVERLRAGKTAVVQGERSDACTVAVRLGEDDAATPDLQWGKRTPEGSWLASNDRASLAEYTAHFAGAIIPVVVEWDANGDCKIEPALPTHTATGAGPVRDATDAMIEAGLKVDMTNEDERGYLHNVWYAMVAAHPAGAGLAGEAVMWRDMTSAPKDATEIILRIPSQGWPDHYAQIAHWAEDLSGEEQPPFRGWFRKTGYGCEELADPTGWRPLFGDARPVEPGEVERLTRERDEAVSRYASAVKDAAEQRALAERLRVTTFQYMNDEKLSVADEREACAKEAEEDYTPGYGPGSEEMEWLAKEQRKEIAERIRARAALTGDAQAGRSPDVPIWGRWFPHDEAPGGSYACLYRNGELPVSLAWMPAQGRPTMPDTVVMPFRMPGDAQEAGR